VRRVVVSPGDFILADEDGAIVIPQSVLDETLRRAEVLTDQETKLRLELMNGLSLEQAGQQNDLAIRKFEGV
jgi:4-hydroxy-4-methyl-2-oxoglutarate aldolase